MMSIVVANIIIEGKKMSMRLKSSTSSRGVSLGFVVMLLISSVADGFSNEGFANFSIALSCSSMESTSTYTFSTIVGVCWTTSITWLSNSASS